MTTDYDRTSSPCQRHGSSRRVWQLILINLTTHRYLFYINLGPVVTPAAEKVPGTPSHHRQQTHPIVQRTGARHKRGTEQQYS